MVLVVSQEEEEEEETPTTRIIMRIREEVCHLRILQEAVVEIVAVAVVAEMMLLVVVEIDEYSPEEVAAESCGHCGVMEAAGLLLFPQH